MNIDIGGEPHNFYIGIHRFRARQTKLDYLSFSFCFYKLQIKFLWFL